MKTRKRRSRYELNPHVEVVVRRVLAEEMTKCAELAAPNEGSALLFGTITERRLGPRQFAYAYVVEEVVCANRARADPVSFVMDDEEVVAHWVDAARRGWVLVGVFHSHPAAAYPSGVDETFMVNMHELRSSNPAINVNFKYKVWVIQGHEETNAFLYVNGKIQQVVLTVTP
ncbi:MAG: hypothetical protein Kow0069_00550 [Promethearchaeota archaeon]